MLMVPAEAAHVLAMMATPELRLTLPRSHYRLVLAQLLVSDAYAFFVDSEAAAPVAIVGMAPVGDGTRDCWLLISPAAASRMGRFVRAVERLLAGHTGCICFVRPDNPQGQRLAALLGFVPEDHFVGRHQRWRRS